MSTAATVFAYTLYAIAAYNLTKLPWYCGLAPVPSYGLELSMPLHLLGYRAKKLQSHPFLFLFFHVIMGASILTLFGLRLQGRHLGEWVGAENMDVVYFTLAIVFAVHAFPERSGVPNRTLGKPLNEISIGIIFIAALLQYFGVFSSTTNWSIVLAPCLAAGILELLPKVFIFFCKKISSGGSYRMDEGPEGDTPLAPNMTGYAGFCPCARALDPRPDVNYGGRGENQQLLD